VAEWLRRRIANPVGSAREGSNPFLSVMASFEEQAANLQLKGLVITMILSALGFLVALQWRDAISATIDLLIPAGEGLIYTYMATGMVTVIAVIMAFVLIKLQQANLIPDRHEERLKNGVKKRVKKVVKK
jgi:hypothetical protein